MIAVLELMDDDVAPCATAENPKDSIHSMQLVLNILEEHGTQNHIEFLLILPNWVRFYNKTVNQVADFHVQIGVPLPTATSQRNQLNIA